MNEPELIKVPHYGKLDDDGGETKIYSADTDILDSVFGGKMPIKEDEDYQKLAECFDKETDEF